MPISDQVIRLCVSYGLRRCLYGGLGKKHVVSGHLDDITRKEWLWHKLKNQVFLVNRGSWRRQQVRESP